MTELKAKCPALVELMMPEHENPSGNIFGGVLLAKIDIAGAIAARHVHRGRIVTVAMDKVVFKKPVLRGDLLICWSEVVKVGTTSIKTKIRVEVNRNGEIIPVTEAEAVYVAVNEAGRPIPVGSTTDGAAPANEPDGVCPACDHSGTRAEPDSPTCADNGGASRKKLEADDREDGNCRCKAKKNDKSHGDACRCKKKKKKKKKKKNRKTHGDACPCKKQKKNRK